MPDERLDDRVWSIISRPQTKITYRMLVLHEGNVREGSNEAIIGQLVDLPTLGSITQNTRKDYTSKTSSWSRYKLRLWTSQLGLEKDGVQRGKRVHGVYDAAVFFMKQIIVKQRGGLWLQQLF